MLPRG